MASQSKTGTTVLLCLLYSLLSTIIFVDIIKQHRSTRISKTLRQHTSTTDVPVHSLYFTSLVGKDYDQIPVGFRRAMSENETLIYTDLLRTLDRVTSARNITMFMNYGTLLGSVRHHAFTPWDDDCDVAMPMKHKNTILRLLSNMKVLLAKYSKLRSATNRWDYTFIRSSRTQVRFISRLSKLYNPSNWSLPWPYVDIDFYSENATHIWFQHKTVLAYRRSIVFPLVSRPISGVWLKSPGNAVTYLNKTYGDFGICKSASFYHKTGRSVKSISRLCKTFNNVYSYVLRSPKRNNLTRETLMLGNRTLYSINIGE